MPFRFRWVVLSLLAVTLAVMLDWRSVLNWPLSTIKIQGNFQYLKESQVISLLEPFVGEGFLAADITRIRHELEQNAWVDQARVARDWPDQLAVEITEQQVVSRWGDGGFLNDRAEVFFPAEAVSSLHLPVLDGPDDYADRVWQQFLAWRAVMPDGLTLTGLRLSPQGSWNLQVNDTLVVRLGNHDLEERLARVLVVLQENLIASTDRVAFIDARYSNGVAVRWKNRPASGLSG